jgi:hypothetical protein
VNRDLFDPDEVPALLRDCFEEVETACGAPWRRVVERTVSGKRHVSPKDRNPDRQDGPDDPTSRLHSQYFDYRLATTGWAPSCQCPPAEPRPCVVLDPFLGSGTTALVADRLGRDAIGIELNGEYARMAEARIQQDAGSLFGEPVAVEMPRQLDIFGEATA